LSFLALIVTTCLQDPQSLSPQEEACLKTDVQGKTCVDRLAPNCSETVKKCIKIALLLQDSLNQSDSLFSSLIPRLSYNLQDTLRQGSILGLSLPENQGKIYFTFQKSALEASTPDSSIVDSIQVYESGLYTFWARNDRWVKSKSLHVNILVRAKLAADTLSFFPDPNLVFEEAQWVKVKVKNPGAQLRCEFGKFPTLASPVCGDSLLVSTTQRLYALPFRQGEPSGSFGDVQYKFVTPVPVLDPSPNVFSQALAVKVKSKPGSQIFYTLANEGTSSTILELKDSLIYLPPGRHTLQVWAKYSDWNISTWAGGLYYVNTENTDSAEIPYPSKMPGTYSSPFYLSFRKNSDRSLVRYTLDGSDPVEQSPLFPDSLKISTNLNLLVRAFHPDLKPSQPLHLKYLIRSESPWVYPSDSLSYIDSIVVQVKNISGDKGRLLYKIEQEGWTVKERDFKITLKNSVLMYFAFLKDNLDTSSLVTRRYLVGFRGTSPMPIPSIQSVGPHLGFVPIKFENIPASGKVFFTTNGKKPDTLPGPQNYLYNPQEPFFLYTSDTLKAITYQPGLQSSSVQSQYYRIKAQKPLVKIELQNQGLMVRLIPDSLSLVYYTLENREPQITDALFPESLFINARVHLNLRAFQKQADPSDTLTINYTPYLKGPNPPQIFTSGQLVKDSTQVTLVNTDNTGSTGNIGNIGNVVSTKKIFYTCPEKMNNTDTYSLYTSVVSIFSNCLFKTFSQDSLGRNSDTVMQQVEVFSENPQFDPPPGTVPYGTSVTVKNYCDKCTIWFDTLKIADSNSGQYKGVPLVLKQNQSISAFRKIQGQTPSLIQNHTYRVKLGPPQLEPSKAFQDSLIITLIHPVSGVKMYYTLNGTEPTIGGSSLLYSQPIKLYNTTQIKVIAHLAATVPSDVSTETYTYAPNKVIEPIVLSSLGGTYSTAFQVTLSVQPAHAQIRYTLNGSLPTINDSLYKGPITINKNTILNVMAHAQGYINSPVQENKYFIEPTTPQCYPAFSPTSFYTPGVWITCLPPPEGHELRYALGSVLTPQSKLWTGSLRMWREQTLQIAAFCEGCNQGLSYGGTFRMSTPYISLSAVKLEDRVKIGMEPHTLPVRFSPENATNKELRYIIHDTTLAQIDTTGRVYPRRPGSTRITLFPNDTAAPSLTVNLVIQPRSPKTFALDLNLNPAPKDANFTTDISPELPLTIRIPQNYLEQSIIPITEQNLRLMSPEGKVLPVRVSLSEGHVYTQLNSFNRSVPQQLWLFWGDTLNVPAGEALNYKFDPHYKLVYLGHRFEQSLPGYLDISGNNSSLQLISPKDFQAVDYNKGYIPLSSGGKLVSEVNTLSTLNLTQSFLLNFRFYLPAALPDSENLIASQKISDQGWSIHGKKNMLIFRLQDGKQIKNCETSFEQGQWHVLSIWNNAGNVSMAINHNYQSCRSGTQTPEGSTKLIFGPINSPDPLQIDEFYLINYSTDTRWLYEFQYFNTPFYQPLTFGTF